jgi:hypothetical protein
MPRQNFERSEKSGTVRFYLQCVVMSSAARHLIHFNILIINELKMYQVSRCARHDVLYIKHTIHLISRCTRNFASAFRRWGT